ncbi:alpha-1,2-fucosyltransferase [Mucilaginibacter angelicae]|uniref:Alpha-1,2-fucosyltransferase n=1 Tax=Mucilaginibacter angelicae TaxID=869718 RepID=A0ABV6L3B1_9SPHI
MIILNLMGGVGNQMFQYAFGKALSIKYNLPLALDITIYSSGNSNRSFDLEIFEIKEYRLASIPDTIRSSTNKNICAVTERKFEYDSELMQEIDKFLVSEANPVLIFTGYWQSCQYFKAVSEQIKTEFNLRNNLSGKWLELSKKIAATDAVMINVRRGDYLQKLDYHGVVSEDYLRSAIQYVLSVTPSAMFYVFSDDMPWCRETLTGYQQLCFVDEAYYDLKYQSYFKLMTACKHFIIANSTFAWWSAWLGAVEGALVIYPEKWFAAPVINARDLFPAEWIAM